MATYAGTEDVEDSLGRVLTASESSRATRLLARIERRITSRISDLTDRISSEDDLQDLVVEAEADAVARVLRNPEGYLQEQDGDYMYIRDRSIASGALGLTTEEWARLGVAGGAFTIMPGRGR